MTFPYPTFIPGKTEVVIAASNAGTSGAANTHTINLPSGIQAGDLLLLFFCTRDGRTFTPPTGWSTLASSGSPIRLSIAWKIATGSEGATTTCSTSSTASRSAHVTARISGFQGTPEISAIAEAQTNSPNPPNMAPTWGATSETLFIAAYGDRNVVAPSGLPAGYADLVAAFNGSSDPALAMASKKAVAASDDPGTFLTASVQSWSACTVAVRSA